jgi:FlaG/FlaF family flagellin (archaellin)
MVLISSRKGLTPVIAIVLLLFITVGAVGVVYTQFSGIIDQGQESTQQTLSSLTSSVDIVNGESGCNIVNTDNSDAVDLSNAVLVSDGSVVNSDYSNLQAGGTTNCDGGSNPDGPLKLQVDGSAIASSGN